MHINLGLYLLLKMVGGSGHNGRLGTYKTVGMAETVGSIHIKEALEIWAFDHCK